MHLGICIYDDVTWPPVTVGELYRLARLLRDVALLAAAEPGESPAPLGVVAITDDISHHEPTTVGEIATRTGLAQSLVSKTVAQLQQEGVVATRQDATDRRRTRIAVTGAARTQILKSRGARGVSQALHERFPQFSKEQLSRIERLFDQLAAELSEQ
jgi:DNA-binding MarR family transcriptional regulator